MELAIPDTQRPISLLLTLGSVAMMIPAVQLAMLSTGLSPVGRIWSVALRTTADPEDASDALQDAMVSAYRNAASFRGDSAVTTWLHRIVVNACLDRMRRRRARPTVPLPEEDAESGSRGLPDPRDDLDAFELRMEIERALAALPDDQRAAIVLVDVEGWSVAEAAEALGVPEGTVKSRCSRGRARLAVAVGAAVQLG